MHDYFGESIHPGDVFLLNDPYRGGNHLPDLTAFVPVFDGDELAFWSINRSHQSDIGGATHGAYNPLATEIWQEGLRIPPLRLYDRGRLREDVYEMIVLNVRHPRDFCGTAGDGVKYPACGMNGGCDGLPHRYTLRSAGRRTRELKTKEAGVELRPGDVIHVRSGGGGGWGDPGERSAEALRRDLRDGFVTRRRRRC